MPSKSKAQQKFMGMVHALQKGDMKPSDASTSVKKAAQSMKKSDAKDYASTSHKGLPKKVKQEILNRLKEYANKMGRDHLGGDDYTSKKKGGLRDFDGYDNVDYNKDMPMDEVSSSDAYKISRMLGTAQQSTQDFIEDNKIDVKKLESYIKKLSPSKKSIIKDIINGSTDKRLSTIKKGLVKQVKESLDESMMSTIDQIRKDSNSVKDFIKKVFSDKDFRDMKGDKDFIKYLGSIYEGVTEGGVPQNWMSGRTSDYHTKLRGKKRKYDDSNFDKENSGQPDLEEATKPDFNSKGYKEASKLVAKLRSSVFKKMSDDDLDQFRMVLAQAFDLKEGVNEGGYSLDDLIGQVKTFNKPKTRKLLTIYVINKLKEKRNNSKSSSNKIKIQKLIDKIEGEYKKGKYLKEFGSRLTEPFLLPKDEDKLDGTPPSKDAIDSDLEEEYKRDYKAEYKKFQSSTKSKKYRAELNKYNRQKGTYGNGDGKDASHKGGKIVGFESESKNRGRREKSRLKKK